MGHYDPGDFWSLTPRELIDRLKASARRQAREYNERTTQSYYTAVLPLMKKIPKLERLLALDEPKPARKQKVEEQIAIALQWTAATSGR